MRYNQFPAEEGRPAGIFVVSQGGRDAHRRGANVQIPPGRSLNRAHETTHNGTQSRVTNV